MGASDRQTISKRVFLRLNRDAAIALIRQCPQLRPLVRIATGHADLA
jgi:hypothetical protein